MILDDLGLMAALDVLAEAVAARTGLWVKVEGQREDRLFPRDRDRACTASSQEALNNVYKHAQAARGRSIVVRREARRGLLLRQRTTASASIPARPR